MATEEHKRLADIIKRTHAALREEAQVVGPETAWRRHLKRKDLLQEYAASMQKLATTYWAENNSDSSNGIHCRVEWVKAQCNEYFQNSGERKYDEREADILVKINSNCPTSNETLHQTTPTNDQSKATEKHLKERKIKLLDVGSCYNPFQGEDAFDVTAIDLHGIPGYVFQCDFLNVATADEQTIDDNEILQLKQGSFDVVVFSLFLEYLPCPKQRYICCEKAYNLLRNGGLLLIITPDSKHVNANVRFMKSWRYLLSKLGFMRIKYEKSRHLHCIAFRRCAERKVASRWAEMQNFPKDDPLFVTEDSIYIPQDFRVAENDDKSTKLEYNEDELKSVFNELPLQTA